VLEDWLSEVEVEDLKTIEDVIKFNIEHRKDELPESAYHLRRYIQSAKNLLQVIPTRSSSSEHLEIDHRKRHMKQSSSV
jgi:hypothetical protein